MASRRSPVALNSPAAGSDPEPGTVRPSALPLSSLPPSLSTTAAIPPGFVSTSASLRPSFSVKPEAKAAARNDRPSPSATTPSSMSSSGPPTAPSPPPPAAPVKAAAPSSAPPPPLPHWFVVFYAVIKDTDGRDKALKALQYGLRYVRWAMKQQPAATTTLLIAALRMYEAAGNPLGPPSMKAAAVAPAAASGIQAVSTTSGPASSAFSPTLLVPLSAVDFLLGQVTSRMDGLTSVISTTRKTIRLFKWCYTIPIAWKNYHKWRAERKALDAYYRQPHDSSSTPPVQPLLIPGFPPLPLLSTVELSNNLLAIATDMSEDTDFYTKQRLLPEGWNATAARTTIVLWFFTVVIDLALTTRAAALQLEEHTHVQQQLDRKRRVKAQGQVKEEAGAEDEAALERRLASSRDGLYNTSLTWLKFFFDFGVALPSLYRQQSEREGLVQFMGCASAVVATYKLILAVK